MRAFLTVCTRLVGMWFRRAPRAESRVRYEISHEHPKYGCVWREIVY